MTAAIDYSALHDEYLTLLERGRTIKRDWVKTVDIAGRAYNESLVNAQRRRDDEMAFIEPRLNELADLLGKTAQS